MDKYALIMKMGLRYVIQLERFNMAQNPVRVIFTQTNFKSLLA